MGEPLVIVGNGMAATRLVDELWRRAPGRYDVTVIGDEPALAYNRVLLSSLLAQEVEERDIELKPRSWWDERGVTLITGRRVTEIDVKGRFVRVRGGGRVFFSKLVLATGSEAIRLPLPGAHLRGVLTFRNRADVAEILERSRAGSRAVVIGGGLLGLEAAAGLAKAGVGVSVVHLMDRLMERQLDEPAAACLKSALEARGIEVILNAESAAVVGRRKVAGLRLKDGRTIEAQMVIMAVGIRASAGLARLAGLAVNRGIKVDDNMQTSAPGIYAVGECAEHRGACYGLVEPAYEQARALADHLTDGGATYAGSLLSTNLKVSGIPVFSAGEIMADGNAETIVLKDPGRGAYRKLVLRQDRLTGAVLVGDADDALWYLDLIRSGRSVAALRHGLVFGRAFSETAEAHANIEHQSVIPSPPTLAAGHQAAEAEAA
jgi:nitrite reductase [NAD(P)H] large subunit